MGQNFLSCDREQELLLPPSLREWLPPDHLAWFVIDLVEELDTDAFYAAYRADWHGRAAHDPSMVLALLVYGYSVGERSSRRIQRRCVEDVAFRVIAANQVPDHATIARFRQRHEQALGALFGQVLELCARAGLVHLDLVAVDGTKIAANASRFANRTYEQLARAIIGEAVEVDAAEDAEHGSGPTRRDARAVRPARCLQVAVDGEQGKCEMSAEALARGPRRRPYVARAFSGRRHLRPLTLRASIQ